LQFGGRKFREPTHFDALQQVADRRYERIMFAIQTASRPSGGAEFCLASEEGDFSALEAFPDLSPSQPSGEGGEFDLAGLK
jgi:hypothetical protein